MANRLALVVLLCVFVMAYAKNGQLTRYCSFPPCCESNISPPYTDAEYRYCPGSGECEDYSGCRWEGQFAFCGSQSHAYVVNTNIVSLFSTHGDLNQYKNKMIRVQQGGRSIDAVVCDTCADSDCDGCCTRNAGSSGYLIDMESNTLARFGGSDGPVTWECINC